MIFKPELVGLILKGKKTMTRRVANGKPCRYEVGHDYAVQPGRGKTAVGRISVLDVERQQLGDLTFADARAEGFRTTADFARYWMRLHDTGYEPNGSTPEHILERWHQRHGAHEVWVITFELLKPVEFTVPDKPLYLHRSPTRGTTTDATRKAPGEPEVIDGRTRRGSSAIARRKREEVDRVMRQQASALGAELRELVLGAWANGHDITALVSQDLAELKRKAIAA